MKLVNESRRVQGLSSLQGAEFVHNPKTTARTFRVGWGLISSWLSFGLA